MDSDRFDALSRLLATPMPRRSSLGLLTSALAGALLPGLVPRRAQAQCGGFICSGISNTCCPNDWTCCHENIGLEVCCDYPAGMFCDESTAPGCVAVCPQGHEPCGRKCCGDGEVCVDPTTSTCGSCSSSVSRADAGTCCPPGQTSCPDGCKDTHGFDPKNCGACGTVCDAAHPTCCAGVCVDTNTNPDFCGGCAAPICDPPNRCVQGLCQCAPFYSICGLGQGHGTTCCLLPETCCIRPDGSPYCASLDSDDPFNCGACGKECLPGEECKEGKCKKVKKKK
jgi:Stigma-specific protein, Stig1